MIEVKIKEQDIDVEEISVMHVDRSTLTIKYGMGQQTINFESEDEAVNVMDALKILSQVAVDNIGLY